MKFRALLPLLLMVSCTKPEPTPPFSRTEYLVGSMNYFQTAAEFRALCYQSFAAAQMSLDITLSTKPKKKPAVIVDIDETVLDNSPYQARQVFNGQVFPEGWLAWTGSGSARAIPGSVEFLKYAASKKVEVFYITNRKPEERKGTIKNLDSLGFPNADTSHVFFREAESSKEGRRQRVAQTHDIVLLCGDNLNDFTEGFEKKSVADRFVHLEKFRSEFGKRFIVLPNPLYGDWEGAIYNYNYREPDSTKDRLRKEALRLE